MTIMTRVFGEITIDDDRIIKFSKGIVGFPDLTDFALLHDSEKGTDSIHWLQSLQVCPDYNPEVDDEILQNLGELNPDEMLVLVTMTVPKDVKLMSVNLKGPIVINAAQKTAIQVIVEGDEYPVKFPIYDILEANKKKAGD